MHFAGQVKFLLTLGIFSNVETLEWGKKYWDVKVCYSSFPRARCREGVGEEGGGAEGRQVQGRSVLGTSLGPPNASAWYCLYLPLIARDTDPDRK